MTNLPLRQAALKHLRNSHLPLSQDIIDTLSDDVEFLVEAATIKPQYIQFANPQLLHDKAFAIKLLDRATGTYKLMPDAIRADKDCFLAALYRERDLTCPGPFFNDPDFLIKASRFKLEYILYAGELLNDKTFALKAIRGSSAIYRLMPESIRADKECALAALNMHFGNLAYTSDDLRNDKDVIMKAIQQETCFNAPMYSSPSLDMASDALKNDPDLLQAVQNQIKSKMAQAEAHERNY